MASLLAAGCFQPEEDDDVTAGDAACASCGDDASSGGTVPDASGARPDGATPDAGEAPAAPCEDDDGDGYGSGAACLGPDCADDDRAVNGGASERCNGVDDDCDGRADEGTLNACDGCVELRHDPGAACGSCGAGRWRCDGPERLVCEGPGLNECGGCGAIDGRVGDSCGRCGLGVMQCDGPDRLACVGDRTNRCGECGEPPPEQCDGRDDDCDGAVDEGVGNACGGCGRLDGRPGDACGACGTGRLQCAGHDGLDCVGDQVNRCGGCGPVPEEACNGRDDDCDGRTDEGVSNACGGCGPVPAEVCNERDDDCDGQTDEGLVCEAEVTFCLNDLLAGRITRNTVPGLADPYITRSSPDVAHVGDHWRLEGDEFLWIELPSSAVRDARDVRVGIEAQAVGGQDPVPLYHDGNCGAGAPAPANAAVPVDGNRRWHDFADIAGSWNFADGACNRLWVGNVNSPGTSDVWCVRVRFVAPVLR